MKITLLYQVSHYIRVKKTKNKRNIKSWDQQNYIVISVFCYIQPLYNEVPLYIFLIPYNTQKFKIRLLAPIYAIPVTKLYLVSQTYSGKKMNK